MMKKLLLAIIFAMFSTSFALQGGPTQPDYIEFETSDMKDMVNLLSGNFAYSIPLGEVPGAYGSYPLSISYHAGISPQKEASWVGLGWTLSPGSIIRDVRGVPDDQFHGGTLGYIYQYSAMYTWGIDLSYSNGVYSVGLSTSNLGGTSISASYGLSIGEYSSLGFKISTTQGVGIDGDIGFGGGKYGLNASAMFSPGSGDLTLGAGASTYGINGNDMYKASIGVQYTTGQDVSFNAGMSTRTKNKTSSLSLASDGSTRISSGAISASLRKNGASVSLGPVSISVANSSSKGGWNHSSTEFSVMVPTVVGIFSLGFNQTLHEYYMRSATSDYVYGYMYQGGPAILADRDNNIDEIPDSQTRSGKSKKRIPWDWTFKGRTLETLGDEKMHPAYDMFTIESEGVAGTFRAFPREEHQMFSLLSNYTTEENKTVEHYNPILELDINHWPESEEFVYTNKNDLSNKEKASSEYPSYQVNSNLNAPYAQYKTNFRNEGNRMVYRAEKNEEPLTSGLSFLFLGEGGYYESEPYGGAKGRGTGIVSDLLLKRTLDGKQYALYGSRKVEPIFEDDSPVSKIKGFVITNTNGTKYFFTQPVKSYLKVDYTINQEKGTPVFVDKKMAKSKDLVDHLKEAVLTAIWPPKLIESISKSMQGHLDESCKANSSFDETLLYSYQVNMNPYATQWLLTEIQGADFIKIDENDISKNIGYNVKFHYTEPSLYQWRTPFARPNTLSSDLPNFRIPRNGLTPVGCDTKMFQASFGVKEYVYLESIETGTHTVKFELNNPESEERVDGKGWFFNRVDKDEKKTLPIVVTSALSLKVKSLSSVTSNPVFSSVSSSLGLNFVNFEYDALYVDTDIPELLQNKLKQNPQLIVETDYSKRNIHIGNDISIRFLNNEFSFNVDNDADDMVTKTTGDETKYGLYKIKLKKGAGETFVWFYDDSDKTLFNEASKGNLKIILGENGQAEIIDKQGLSIDDELYKLTQCVSEKGIWGLEGASDFFCRKKEPLIPPFLDWSDVVLAEAQTSAAENQMRYLKKISYYKKKEQKPYREYNFEYDYSLHPKTLNSYCKSRYPETLADIQNSPNKANLDICSVDKTNRNLYGKLTLKSITEKGCQNGRCSSLPPFKFDYNAASQTSTRLSSKDVLQSFRGALRQIMESFGMAAVSDNYYQEFTDIDATIIASNNTTDEWGLWNSYANEDNHKVNQSFADYGAAAWSLNKITDPAGGVMEIKYERDVYKNGEDHSDEEFYAPIYRIGKCSKMPRPSDFNSLYNDNACIQLLPMYWKDQCLGPREAYWSLEKPKNYQGNNFDYLDKMGITTNNRINTDTTIIFNARSNLNTDVSCGFLSLADCDRFRNVGLLGSSKFLAMYEILDDVIKGASYYTWVSRLGGLVPQLYENKQTRLLVLDKEYDMIFAGLQLAADKINELQDWDVLSINGNMWLNRKYSTIKGGDLRVKSLVRYDIDRVAKTEYEYEPGEMSQLPDSAYNTVLGNRFNVNLISYAMPDIDLMPKSRIVGFDDGDLLYVPGATVMYPKVTVKNSDDKKSIVNGKTEYEYITPEKGIPEEYIDPETKDSLQQFIHVNVNLMAWSDQFNHSLLQLFEEKDSPKPFVMTFDFVDNDGQAVGESMNIMLSLEKPTSFTLYHDNIKNIRKIHVSYKRIINGTEFSERFGDVDVGNLNDFNDVALTISYIKGNLNVHKNWQRSQEKGYYPILYKRTSYDKKFIKIDKVQNNCIGLLTKHCFDKYSDSIDVIFEKQITYHDFTAFIGMNKKISYYRGNDDKAMLLKVDSNVYSTRVPDVLEGIADGNNVESKIGKQVERWNSKRELQCLDDNADCKKNQKFLSVYDSNEVNLVDKNGNQLNQKKTYFQDSVSFKYIRYPVFQIASVTSNGFDNQEKQFDVSSSSGIASSSSCDARCARNQNRRHKTVTENHKYDPVTSAPTATVAKIPAFSGKELHKLTVKLPHHAVLENSSSGGKSATALAKFLFKKNMLSQNFADFVYYDSVPVNSSTSWKNLEKVKYLKSFSMNPLNKFTKVGTCSNANQNSSDQCPYVEWGTFTTKSNPVQILGGNSAPDDAPYVFVAQYQNIGLGGSSSHWPNKQDFSGNHILQVDKYFRPVEVEDELKRVLSSHYTDDGLHQTGLFYPANLNKTASMLPYGNVISTVNVQQSVTEAFNVDAEKGGMVAKSSITLSCNIFTCDTTLVAEYRMRKHGQKWVTDRKKVSDLHLTLNSGEILNYIRIYPENAEAKSYVYDRYGNIIQIVAEDNTSTYYEYNPFGKLIQTRDDDGVSFKSHHREFRNDSKNEIPWTETVSQSSGNQ